jgi:hypothetical protein
VIFGLGPDRADGGRPRPVGSLWTNENLERLPGVHLLVPHRDLVEGEFAVEDAAGVDAAGEDAGMRA